jgi:hypothetical protein
MTTETNVTDAVTDEVETKTETKTETTVKVKKNKSTKGNCPACGGVPYKRGWKHTDECPNSTKNKLAALSKEKQEYRAANGLKSRGKLPKTITEPVTATPETIPVDTTETVNTAD